MTEFFEDILITNREHPVITWLKSCFDGSCRSRPYGFLFSLSIHILCCSVFCSLSSLVPMYNLTTTSIKITETFSHFSYSLKVYNLDVLPIDHGSIKGDFIQDGSRDKPWGYNGSWFFCWEYLRRSCFTTLDSVYTIWFPGHHHL